MFRSFAHAFLIYLLALGLVLPQATGVLAALGLSNGQYVVICTGDSLKTILIDDNGNPVEQTEETRHCALVNAVDTAGTAPVETTKLRYLYTAERLRPKPLIMVERPVNAALPRAPPVM